MVSWYSTRVAGVTSSRIQIIHFWRYANDVILLQEFDEDLRPLVIDTTNTREQSLASSSSCCSPSNPDLTQAQQDDPTMGMAHELNSTHSTSDTSMITSLKEYEVAPQQLADMLGTNIKPVKHSSPSKTRRKSDKVSYQGHVHHAMPATSIFIPHRFFFNMAFSSVKPYQQITM